ncbi:MAG: AMP-binding protein [Kofleriaceae bacterium]|nr:AMP-binding protein [Kofleriaceae bacterium]
MSPPPPPASPSSLRTRSRSPSSELAVVDDQGRAFDHAALHRRAAAWAAALARRHGVRAGDRVGVLADGCTEVFVLRAACEHLGAALTPLSWRLSTAELAAVTADAAPRVLLHDRAHADVAAALDAPRAVLDAPPPRVAPVAAAPALPDDVVQVLYTSGSTGRPRGARLTRRQLAFNAAITARLCGLGAADRVLALLPLFHTGGLNCLATPVLAAGGAVMVMARFDPAEAVARIERHGVTAIVAVPTIYDALLDAGLDRRRAPALRVRLVGGAPVTPRLLERARAAGLPLRQGFGMTEVGPNCFTFGPVGPSDGDASSCVGAPVPGTEARLVDDGGADVAPGATGELWLRGPHVFAGYLGRASSGRPDGWFATGDLFRRDAAGGYHVVGRKKDMFISGGENVYPGEVEAALAGHPAIAEVCVIGRPDPRWGEVGVAVVATRGPVDAAALDAWLRRRLAAYKVPRAWRFVTALPRTATGKIARAELIAAARAA